MWESFLWEGIVVQAGVWAFRLTLNNIFSTLIVGHGEVGALSLMWPSRLSLSFSIVHVKLGELLLGTLRYLLDDPRAWQDIVVSVSRTCRASVCECDVLSHNFTREYRSLPEIWRCKRFIWRNEVCVNNRSLLRTWFFWYSLLKLKLKGFGVVYAWYTWG